jgi:two-component system sensor histidine kinase ChiS
MALFPQDANRAVLAAIAMQHQVAQYNAKRQAQGRQAIAIGIGIHTGSLILGTIGEEQRMESTVISDAVNLAARLEKITKLYGAGIVISADTLTELQEPHPFRHRFLDRVQPQGKREMVEIWEVYEGDAPSLAQQKENTQALFEKGVYFYHNDQVEEAQGIFDAISQINPGDRATSFYLQRCRQHVSHSVTQDVVAWDALVGDR